jgi:hypothetical protein
MSESGTFGSESLNVIDENIIFIEIVILPRFDADYWMNGTAFGN